MLKYERVINTLTKTSSKMQISRSNEGTCLFDNTIIYNLIIYMPERIVRIRSLGLNKATSTTATEMIIITQNNNYSGCIINHMEIPRNGARCNIIFIENHVSKVQVWVNHVCKCVGLSFENRKLFFVV